MFVKYIKKEVKKFLFNFDVFLCLYYGLFVKYVEKGDLYLLYCEVMIEGFKDCFKKEFYKIEMSY